MASETASESFLLHIDEIFEDSVEFISDNFRTVCQIALKENKSLTASNIKTVEQEINRTFKEKIIEAASLRNTTDTLLEFVNEFMSASDEEDSGGSSDENNDLLEKESSSESEAEQLLVETASQSCNLESALEIPDLRADKVGTNRGAPVLENPNIQWLQIPETAVKERRFDIIQICADTDWPLEVFRNKKDLNLLTIALLEPHLDHDIIRFLLKQIDVNLGAVRGVTPLHGCLSNLFINGKEKLTVLRQLLLHGADCNKIADSEGSPLQSYMDALQFINSEDKLDQWQSIIELLLEHDAKLDIVGWFRHSIISIAVIGIPTIDGPFAEANSVEEGLRVRNSKVKLVEYLLQRGADPNSKDKSGRTSLHCALVSQSPDVVKILIQHGADVNAVTNTRASPIYYLCYMIPWDDEDSIQNVFLPMIQILHDAKADMNIKAVDGSTVLHFAAAKMNETICSYLIEFGAKLDVVDYLHRTPLHMASRNKLNPETASTLIKFGAELNPVDVNKSSPLHTACLFGNTEGVRILLENGASVSMPDELGIQPIHTAAENGDEKMLEYLLFHGAEIHAEDQWKASPLHYAASDGNSEGTEYLLKCGADKYRKDGKGRCPLDLGRYRGHYLIATLLADEDHQITFGNFPPHLFPNRKLVEQSCVNDYFQDITERIKATGQTCSDISEAILGTAGLGRVDLQRGESKQIFDNIVNLVQEIADRMGEIDPVFRCIVHTAGSTSERVKLGYPDEFDFVCELINFNAMILRIEKGAIPVFAKVQMKSPVPEDYSRFCMRSSGRLNAAEILRYFHQLAKQAIFDVLSKGHKHIYAGLSLLHHHDFMFDETLIPLHKLPSFCFTWRGDEHKLLDISIDMNPVIFTEHWPEEALKECILLKDISKYGVFLIPKYCKTNVGLPDQMVSPGSDLWRYSTHHVESAVMKALPAKVNDCYMLCKAFRMEPLTCSVQVSPYFHIVSDKKVNMAGYTESLNSSSEACNLSEGAALDTADMHGIKSGSVDAEEMVEEDDELDDDGDDFLANENEITAESLIPSYYLKTIFLKEIAEIFDSLEDFSHEDSQNITRKVYEKLLEAVESQHMTTLFFPSSEIYSDPSHDNLQAVKDLRHAYCLNILNLIKALGF